MPSTSSICCSHNSILNFISSCNQEFTFEKSKERQRYIFLQPPHLVLHVSLLQLLLIEQPTKLGELLTQQLDLRTPQWREEVGLESTWNKIYTWVGKEMFGRILRMQWGGENLRCSLCQLLFCPPPLRLPHLQIHRIKMSKPTNRLQLGCGLKRKPRLDLDLVLD